MDPTTPPATPGTPAGAENQPNQTPQQNPNEGIQKRIDELTARFWDAERRAEEQTTLNQQLLAQTVQLQMQLNQPPQPAPPAIEPETKAQLDAYMGPHVRQLNQTVAQLQLQLAQSQVQALAATRGLPPEVATKAQGWVTAWARQGIMASPEQALAMAAGEAYLTGGIQAQGTKPSTQPAPDIITSTGAAPGPVPQAPGSEPKSLANMLPSNLGELGNQQQAQVFGAIGDDLERRLEGKTW